jgi:hypothetical protein
LQAAGTRCKNVGRGHRISQWMDIYQSVSSYLPSPVIGGQDVNKFVGMALFVVLPGQSCTCHPERKSLRCWFTHFQ